MVAEEKNIIVQILITWHFQVVNAIRDDRQNVAARVEREKLARECGSTEAEAENPEPPVEEMSKLKIKTLSDYSTAEEK